MGRGSGGQASRILYGPGEGRRQRSAGSKGKVGSKAQFASAAFEHPDFKPGQRRLGTDSFFEDTTLPGLPGRFSGSNEWAARCPTIPKGWRRKQTKYDLNQNPGPGGYGYFLFNHPAGSQPVQPVKIEAAKKANGRLHWYSELALPHQPPGLPGICVNADYAMAVYKLAGERGRWQLEWREGINPATLIMTLRDDDDEVLGFVRLSPREALNFS